MSLYKEAGESHSGLGAPEILGSLDTHSADIRRRGQLRRRRLLVWFHRHSMPLNTLLEKEVNIHWHIQLVTCHYLPQSKIKLFVKA